MPYESIRRTRMTEPRPGPGLRENAKRTDEPDGTTDP